MECHDSGHLMECESRAEAPGGKPCRLNALLLCGAVRPLPGPGTAVRNYVRRIWRFMSLYSR